MDKQRIYDAMLIKAFRKDVTTGMLNYWLRPYDINIPDPELKRQPPANNMRVQSFVGIYLKPVADRLWDTDKSKDVETLDWMQQFKCEDTNHARKKEIEQNRWQQRKQKALTYAIKTTLYNQHTGNQWGVTKAPVRIRRVKLK